MQKRRDDELGILTCAHVVKPKGAIVMSHGARIGITHDISTPEDNKLDCAYIKLDEEIIPHARYALGDETVVRRVYAGNVYRGMEYKFIGISGVCEGSISSTSITCLLSGVILEHQLLLSNPVQLGDSGSLVINKDDEAIGLVIGTSNQGGIAHPIGPVLDFLDVDIVLQ